MPRRLFILLPLICMLIACQPVRDAQQTVAMADSLRVNEGITCDDSLALAEAYSTLGHWRLIYPDDYARSCYYYGRMLRNRNDQVAAMQAFIRGTHAPYVQRFIPLPQFTDYHILGRIYSNMGTMCHLADEFELSYDMYKQSSEQFYKACDSTSYFYTLNAMALELAELKQHDETLYLLARIEAECTDSNVLTKIWESKAILYRNTAQYDSAIYSVKQLYKKGYRAASGYVVEAQSYWLMQQYDSALHYANLVLSLPCATFHERKRMLYILTNHDQCISIHELRDLSTEREDLNLDYLNPLSQQLSVAVELLRRDLDVNPYLYSVVILGCSLILIITFWILRTHRINLLQASNVALQQKNEDLTAEHIAGCEQIKQQIESNCDAIRHSRKWDDVLTWNKHNKFCEVADRHLNLLATKLQSFPELNEREIHLCILVVIGNFSDKQLAALLNYGDKSIRGIKRRTAMKLGTTSANLREFLMQLVIK